MDYYTDPSMQGRGYSTTNVKLQKVNDDLSISISKGFAAGATPITKVDLEFASDVTFIFSGEEKTAIDGLIRPLDGMTIHQSSCDEIVMYCMARILPSALYSLIEAIDDTAFKAGKEEARSEMRAALGIE
jgi:hypothetical protein